MFFLSITFYCKNYNALIFQSSHVKRSLSKWIGNDNADIDIAAKGSLFLSEKKGAGHETEFKLHPTVGAGKLQCSVFCIWQYNKPARNILLPLSTCHRVWCA
jgi:hypothetical protein